MSTENTDASGTSAMATNMSTNNLFFTKLIKYTGEINEDLNTWLREFYRCCLIAGKTDDLVKGQHLMLLLLVGQKPPLMIMKQNKTLHRTTQR